jgi:hypothetical protein
LHPHRFLTFDEFCLEQIDELFPPARVSVYWRSSMMGNGVASASTRTLEPPKCEAAVPTSAAATITATATLLRITTLLE